MKEQKEEIMSPLKVLSVPLGTELQIISVSNYHWARLNSWARLNPANTHLVVGYSYLEYRGALHMVRVDFVSADEQSLAKVQTGSDLYSAFPIGFQSVVAMDLSGIAVKIVGNLPEVKKADWERIVFEKKFIPAVEGVRSGFTACAVDLIKMGDEFLPRIANHAGGNDRIVQVYDPNLKVKDCRTKSIADPGRFMMSIANGPTC